MSVILALSLVLSGCSNENTSANAGPADTDNSGDTTAELSAVALATGFSRPVFVCSAPGDDSRLFVVEKAGRIMILRDGAIQQLPYLDITDRVGDAGGEQGLLGMAFDPDYSTTGFFYVNYTDNAGSTVVARFKVSDLPDQADASSEELVLKVNQPFSNHNAGMLAFSPVDGYLYVGLGDGGSGGDPQDNAQDPATALGKMLRIDVGQGLPYAVPPDNPFRGSVDTLDEIWSFGLRNPWRYSFDRLTGDLYIGDVGQSRIEEVDFSPASSKGGENYGWRLKEGNECFNPAQGCESGRQLVDPIYQYRHSDPSSPCSITGGYVYRGVAFPELVGAYFFGDFCSGQVWSLRYENGTVADFADRTGELGLGQAAVASFGEDNSGELYIVDFGGTVYKVVPKAP
ncbi:MAG: PQQ-dependent sugar dehydrogenase [Candidatus Zixiibacteriota bacterium]|nr:MAG: PQQ-dependent sugar dehydrogenase [candidate division Zixibacteria bacterium]